MKKIIKAMMLSGMMLASTTISAEEILSDETPIITLDADMVPITFVNKTIDELKAGVGELETILETENFQLYQAGDFSYKVVDGIVVSQSIQIEDSSEEKLVYNKILNQLAQSKFIKDTHNTGGNNYQYADFQIQFDDFLGYEKLTFTSLMMAEAEPERVSLFLVSLSPKYHMYARNIARLWFVVSRNGTIISEGAGSTQWEVFIATYP